MEDYLDEREQWERVKAWLREQGPWVLLSVAIVAPGLRRLALLAVAHRATRPDGRRALPAGAQRLQSQRHGRGRPDHRSAHQGLSLEPVCQPGGPGGCARRGRERQARSGCDSPAAGAQHDQGPAAPGRGAVAPGARSSSPRASPTRRCARSARALPAPLPPATTRSGAMRCSPRAIEPARSRPINRPAASPATPSIPDCWI